MIFVANIFWAMSYDTIYALMDIEDDRVDRRKEHGDTPW